MEIIEIFHKLIHCSCDMFLFASICPIIVLIFSLSNFSVLLPSFFYIFLWSQVDLCQVIYGNRLSNPQWTYLYQKSTIPTSHFRKKRFEINFFVRQNASKFAIFIEKENPRSFFSFRAFLSFTLQILKPILIFLKSGKLSTESGAPEWTKKCESALNSLVRDSH